MTQISWQHQKILWVYGPQSGLTLFFGKWRFDDFAYIIHWDFTKVSFIVEPAQWLIREKLLFLVIVENKSGSKLSAHTITPQNNIGEWFTAFRFHSINHLFQTTHVILLWSVFSVTTTTLLFIISLVTPLK